MVPGMSLVEKQGGFGAAQPATVLLKLYVEKLPVRWAAL
jgi:hypothetical protein